MNNLESRSYFANKKALIVLILILILGSVLRFYGLENQSLWQDELMTYDVTNSNNLSDVIYKGIHFENKIPGYFVILYFFTKYLGDSESILRLPSAISGILSIFVIFLLGVRLFSYKEGLIASALMATLLCPVYYSQEAHPYSMLLLFTMLSTYFWISLLEHLHKSSAVRHYTVCGYIITAILSCYLHYYGLYLIALQGLAAALVFIPRRKLLCAILFIYAPIVVAILPWLPTMWYHYNSGTFSHLQPPATNYFMLYLVFLFNSGRLLLVVLLLYLFLFLRILYTNMKPKKYNEARSSLLPAELLFLLLWLAIPYIGMHIVSKLSAPLLQFRYLIISLPAAYLLLSRSITQLPLRPWIQTAVAGLIVALFLHNLLFTNSYYSKPSPLKPQFREAVAFVVDRYPLYEDSLIIATVVSLNYYFEKHDSIARADHGGSRWASPRQKTAITRLVTTRNPQYIWFISERSSVDVELIYFLDDNNFTLMSFKRFVGVDVRLFKNDKLIDSLDEG